MVFALSLALEGLDRNRGPNEAAGLPKVTPSLLSKWEGCSKVVDPYARVPFAAALL